MKVLFVSSSNRIGISPIVIKQGESLESVGVSVFYYGIKGKKILGYLSNISKIRRQINLLKPDIIHAHYSLSGIVASMAGAKPLVVSLMGSDVKSGVFFRLLIHLFNFIYNWKYIVVKSMDMLADLKIDNVHVLPNGVDIENFKPLNKNICQNKLGWSSAKIHLLFAANPDRPEKKFILAEQSVKLCGFDQTELHVLKNVNHSEIIYHYNAADVVILSSLWEGSPNVIKEAMACNRPIVSTNVGDVHTLFGTESGHYISANNVEDFASKLKLAIEYSLSLKTTSGRDRIIQQGLDSSTIANRILDLYKKAITKR